MIKITDLVRERFKELTEIQKLAIPKILSGQHVLVLAPTGAGKTESVLLPILEKISRSKEEGIAALYISPLRALGRDLKERFNWWCKRLGISHDIRTGDSSQSERTKHRKNPPKILLTTPESLQALLVGRVTRRHLASLRFVVVDEVHDILDNKRGAQLSMALERLEEVAPRFQRIALSATVADEKDAATLVFGNRPYTCCEVKKNREMDITIQFFKEQDERIKKIKGLAENNRTLIFVNTRSTAEELGASLKKNAVSVDIHHGSLSKDVRIAAESRFKSGEVRTLLATSSLELGIDIGDVDLVVQYGSPRQVSRLIQRVGRSGHALHRTPRGIIFPTDIDDMLESEVISIFARSGWLEPKQIERGAMDVIAHQLVGLCIDKGNLDLKSAHGILSKSGAYDVSLNKLKRIALQLYAEGLLYYAETTDPLNATLGTTRKSREYYYSNLTTIPKERRYALRDIASNRIIASLDERFVLNLETGVAFLAKGQPWAVVDITETEVLAEPTTALDIAIPEWAGEDIAVAFEIAQGVGKMRWAYHKENSVPDDKRLIVEMVDELIIIHGCFGSRINAGLARLFSYNISQLIGEQIKTVSDPYRIMVKLPFQLKEEHILNALKDAKNPRAKLEAALENSFLLRLKFTHVARLFGLFDENATPSQRFLATLRNSVVYEEAIRSIFFRYFDIEGLENVMAKISSGEIPVIVDRKKEPSFFARLGIEKASAGEAIGAFEPRAAMIAALKERTLVKTLELKCLNCNATRFLHLAGAPERIKCHKCGEPAYTIIGKGKTRNPEQETKTAALIRNYGKRALIALSVYGVGPESAERVLKKLHKDEDSFYLDLLEVQKNFIKNRKFWKV